MGLFSKDLAELLRPVFPDAVGQSGSVARFAADGHEVVVRYKDRGIGSSRDPYTEVVLVGFARSDLFLSVVPRSRAGVFDFQIAGGRVTDVTVGDAIWDDMFVVEAAPADAIRNLFERDIRNLMLELPGVGVFTFRGDSELGAGLMIDRPRWEHDPLTLERQVRLALAVAARIPVAYEMADRARRAEAGYRGHVADPTEERMREVREVELKQRARNTEVAGVACLIFILLALAMVGSFLLAVLLPILWP